MLNEPFAYAPRCSFAGCQDRAQFKVAADWSDGTYHELKTYATACAAHLKALKESAEQRRAMFPVGETELIGPLSVYPLAGADPLAG